MVDCVLKGGTVIDGSGSPARVADVAMQGGRIVAVGKVTESATHFIDASGLMVCPGFVDPHTHYDAQLFWDPHASPSNLHGITSIIGGNCGFTLAPLDSANADYLLNMMVKVEGMPKAALEQGVPWNWRSFGDYLSKLEGRLGVNAAFLVGHTALRRQVMGVRSVGEKATERDVEAMKSLLSECIAAGGLGFSTSLAYTHSDGDGQPVPSRWASHDEVLALCEVVSHHEGTTLELVADGCLNGFSPAEIELFTNMSLAGRRPVNWNVLTIDSARPDDYRQQLALGAHAAARGAKVVALTMPVLVGMNMSFLNYCALFMLPDWEKVMNLPVPERMAALRDTPTRIHLESRAASPDAGAFGRLTGWDRYIIGDTYSTANAGLSGRRVGEIARERGQRDFFCLLDIVLNDDLRTVLWPGPTDDDSESWRMRAEAWKDSNVLIGGSDAGAHLDRMCGSSYTTEFLADCLRGRQLATVEEAVRMMTAAPAGLFGLRDRGQLKPGMHGDVVVFDPDRIGAGEPQLVHDLPGGSGRLVAAAHGVEYVYVNGRVTVEGGTATGDLPGAILRSKTDTFTSLPRPPS